LTHIGHDAGNDRSWRFFDDSVFAHMRYFVDQEIEPNTAIAVRTENP